MKRILVFTTNWLGDALFLSPLITNLKNNLPQSYLAVLGVARVKEVFNNNPYIDEFIVYDGEDRGLGLLSHLSFILELRKKGFDTAFIIKPSLSRTLLLKFAGISNIVGFDNPKNGWLLTVKVPVPSKILHKIDYFLALLDHLGFKINQHKYEFFISQEDKACIERLLSKQKLARNIPLVVINPGANWYPKRWPPENFSELIKRIKQRLPINIVITGANKDKDLANRIIIDSGQEVLDLTGQISLGQLGALMQEADIVISADSGPMHIASAVGSKLIALFGPTSARITGPYPLGEHIIIQKDVGCKIPCYDATCKDYRCMEAIAVDEVVEKVTGLLTL